MERKTIIFYLFIGLQFNFKMFTLSCTIDHTIETPNALIYQLSFSLVKQTAIIIQQFEIRVLSGLQ